MAPLKAWLEGFAQYPAFMDLIRDFLIQCYPAIIALLGVIILVFLGLSLPLLGAEFRRFQPRVLLFLGIIMLAGLALRLGYAPLHPQVLYDEVFFFNIAQHIAATGRDLVVFHGYAPDKWSFVPAPIGWELPLALLFKLFGAHDYLGFYLNALLSGLSLGLLFYVAEWLTGSAAAGLCSSAAFAVLPVALRISSSAALEPPTVFLLLATFSLLVLHWRRGNFYTQQLSWFVFLYLVQVRQEGLVVLAPLFAGFILLYRGVRLPWRDPFFYLRGIVGGYFLTPYLLVIWFGLISHYYLFTADASVLDAQIQDNFRYNLAFFFNNQAFPLGVSLFSLLGIVILPARTRLWLLAWTAWVYVFYALAPSCDFTCRHTIDSWRISLFVTLPLLILAGAGAAWLGSRFKPRLGMVLALAGLLYLGSLPLQYHSFIQARTFLTAEYMKLKQLRSQPPGLLGVSCTELKILGLRNLTQMVYWAAGQEVVPYPAERAQLQSAARAGTPAYLYHLGTRFVPQADMTLIKLWDEPSLYPQIWSEGYHLR